jgi:hypothetical protein
MIHRAGGFPNLPFPSAPDDDPFSVVLPDEVESDDDILGEYEREAVRVARVDPVTFLEYAFDWKCCPFHEEWQDFLTENRRAQIFAPTEHGKTGQISQGRVLWELGRNPNLRIVIASAGSTHASKPVGLIKQAIQVNPRVRRVFPWLRRESDPNRMRAWGTTKVIVARPDLTNRDFSLQALGVHGIIEGARVDLLVLDDVLNNLNTATAEQREAVIQWLKSTAIPRTTVRARVWSVGTPWHIDDAMHWIEKNPEYVSKRYDADGGLWPELVMSEGQEYGWPKWRLEQRKNEIGTLEYNRCMRCRALSDEMRIFQVSHINRCIELSGKREFARTYRDSRLYVVTGQDLGHRKKRSSNETVLFTGGVDLQTGIYETISIDSIRGEIADILRLMIDVYIRYAPQEYVVENNAAQAYLEQFIRRKDEILQIIGAKADPRTPQILNFLRIIPFTTGRQKADTEFGIRAMTADFEHARWRVHDNDQTHRWRDEMDRYTETSHPGDRVMGGWFCWWRLRQKSQRSKIRVLKRSGGPPDGQQEIGGSTQDRGIQPRRIRTLRAR